MNCTRKYRIKGMQIFLILIQKIFNQIYAATAFEKIFNIIRFINNKQKIRMLKKTTGNCRSENDDKKCPCTLNLVLHYLLCIFFSRVFVLLLDWISGICYGLFVN